MKKILTVGICLFVSAFALGCSNVEDIIECTDVCESYDGCVAEDVDVTECIDACESYGDVSDANRDQIVLCDDCLDTMGCSADCNAQCSGVIPAPLP